MPDFHAIALSQYGTELYLWYTKILTRQLQVWSYFVIHWIYWNPQNSCHFSTFDDFNNLQVMSPLKNVKGQAKMLRVNLKNIKSKNGIFMC